MIKKFVILLLFIGTTSASYRFALNERMIEATDSRLSLSPSGDRLFKNKPFDGTLIYRRSDGSVWRKEGYLNGRKHGEHISWFPNGKIEAKRQYKNGIKIGTHEGWYPNGQKRFESRHENGVYHGIFQSWYDNGQLFEFIKYDRGEEVHHKKWRRTGQIYANYIWRDGRTYGLKGDKACFKTTGDGIAKN